ncbi:MAG TPA: hypothetical protein VFZ71_07615 [Pyrinomonadaceae bacterium]
MATATNLARRNKRRNQFRWWSSGGSGESNFPSKHYDVSSILTTDLDLFLSK